LEFYFKNIVVKKVAYTLFLFPVIISLIFGTTVLAQVLESDPNRELNMMPKLELFDFKPGELNSDKIKIIGLEERYDQSTPITVQVKVEDGSFDCGDLYITIYDSEEDTVSQRGFFGQCFAAGSLLMPIDDKYSENLEDTGVYELEVSFRDTQGNSITTKSEFVVR
jgi:hypothetical protein